MKKPSGKRKGKTSRHFSGNMLILIVAITAIFLLALLFFALNYNWLLAGYGQHRTAVEAAGLSAAQDLAKIVVDNEHYGFISLSDHPPIGKATVAKDGELLPVFGINTIIGTSRLDWIIANEINDETMKNVAMADVKASRKAASELQIALQDAISGSDQAKDMDGNIVNIYERAKQNYVDNVVRYSNGAKPRLANFSMSLGWLEGGSTTVTNVPQPESKAKVASDQQRNGKYKSFISIPAFGEDFNFAGVGSEASLVNSNFFKPADQQHICSIIRVEAAHATKQFGAKDGEQEVVIKSVACAQPSAKPDLYPSGQLSVAFPGGNVPGISSLNDFFKDPQLNNNPMDIFIPTGNDWPTSGAVLAGPTTPPVISGGGGGPTTSQAFAMGLMDWLRTTRTKPRIDIVLTMLNTKFTAMSSAPEVSNPNFVTYTFDGCPGDPADPRLLAMKNNSSDAWTGFLYMTGLHDVLALVPENSTALKGGPGETTSTNNNQFGSKELNEFWKFLAESNKVAWQTRNNADAVLADTASTAQMKTNATQAKRNADWTIYMSEWMAEHLLDLTLLGIKQESNTNKTGVQNEFTLGEDIYVDMGGNLVKASSGQSMPQAHKLIEMKSLAASIAGIQNSAGGSNSAQNNAGETSGDIQGVSWMHSPGTPSNFYFLMVDDGRAINNSGKGGTSTAFAGSAGSGAAIGGGGGAAPPPPAAPGRSQFRFHMNNDGTITVLYARTPFAGIPVSENQIYGVSLNAMQTGQDPPVTWTATLRDQVRLWGRQNGGRHAGQPSNGAPLDYVNQPAYGGSAGTSPLSVTGGNIAMGATILNPQPRGNYVSGGLSVEMQLRSPIILECNQNTESTTNQSGQDVTPLNPKVPPDFL